MNTIKPYKNRTVNKDKFVFVYRNLHNGLLSIKQKNVIGYTDFILLKNIHFIIHQSGYRETIKNNSKTVHAFVKGYLSNEDICLDNAIQIFYNPYKANYFMNKEGQRITSAEFIKISSDGKMFAINPI